MEVLKKAAAPVPSVGADGEQLQRNEYSKSITGNVVSYNYSPENDEESLEERLRRYNRMSLPDYLPTYSMNEIYDMVQEHRPAIINQVLYPGMYLLAGAPKVGKSFLVAQLAYHVSKGMSIWDCEVKQGTVLYLALEDDLQRLQSRNFRMFGVEDPGDVYFCVVAKKLGNGLEEQLAGFLKEHPNTRLIIIDTLQKVREVTSDKFSYANDYEVIGKMKEFAEKYKICLLAVHHTRKQQAGDRFEMISGTNGLLGCADGALVLQKENRTDRTATLDIVGRDQIDQKLYLVRNEQKLTWELDHAEAEAFHQPDDPLLKAINALVEQEWQGSASELVQLLDSDMNPNALSKHLNVQAGVLQEKYGIVYQRKKTREGRRIVMFRISGDA